MLEKFSWSEIASAAAIVISVATFIWTRVDKWRERHAAKEAKKPLVNISVRATANNRWQANIAIENRGDFDLDLDQISVPAPFSLNFGDGNGGAARHKLSQQISQTNRRVMGCDLVRGSGSAKKVRFCLEFIELSSTERKITIGVRRKLPAFK